MKWHLDACERIRFVKGVNRTDQQFLSLWTRSGTSSWCSARRCYCFSVSIVVVVVAVVIVDVVVFVVLVAAATQFAVSFGFSGHFFQHLWIRVRRNADSNRFLLTYARSLSCPPFVRVRCFVLLKFTILPVPKKRYHKNRKCKFVHEARRQACGDGTNRKWCTDKNYRKPPTERGRAAERTVAALRKSKTIAQHNGQTLFNFCGLSFSAAQSSTSYRAPAAARHIDRFSSGLQSCNNYV